MERCFVKMSADDFKKELSHIVAEVAFKHATSGGGISWTIDSMQEAIYSALKKDWEPAITTTNTASDAIPLWAVRTWLSRNINSNLAYVESKIVEMVGIAERHA